MEEEQPRTKKLIEICKEILQNTTNEQIGDVTKVCTWIKKNAMQDMELEVLLDFVSEFILTGITMLKRARIELKIGRREDKDFVEQLVKTHEDSVEKILSVKRRSNENIHNYKLAFNLEQMLYKYNMLSIKNVQTTDMDEMLERMLEMCVRVRETKFIQSSYVVLHNYMCEYEIQLIRTKEKLSSIAALQKRVEKEFPDFSLLRLPGNSKMRVLVRKFAYLIDVILDKKYFKMVKKSAELSPDGELKPELQNQCFESLAYIELNTSPIPINVYENSIKKFDLYTEYLHTESTDLKPEHYEEVLSAFRCVGVIVKQLFTDKAAASKKRGPTHLLDEYYSELTLIKYYFCEGIMLKKLKGEEVWKRLENALKLALQLNLDQSQLDDIIEATKKWHDWFSEEKPDIDFESFKNEFKLESSTENISEENKKFYDTTLDIFGFKTDKDAL